MRIFNLYLTENELKNIKKESKSLGISKAEMIRRILDQYFSKNK